MNNALYSFLSNNSRKIRYDILELLVAYGADVRKKIYGQRLIDFYKSRKIERKIIKLLEME